MKKGISIWSFAETDLKKCMLLAKEAGFDGIELALDEHGLLSLNSTEEDLKLVKEMANAVDIELYSLACGLYWTYNYTSANKKMLNVQKKLLKNSFG